MKRSDIPLALAAGLVFADATIVTLALPNLLVDLRTTVYGVAAVLAVYTACLGFAVLPAASLILRAGSRWIGVGALALFSLASVVCALAGGLAVLLVARAVQGLAGAVILIVAGSALASPQGTARAWVLIGVLSAAVGPVLGGALTQAFSWRAIFIAQAPVPLLAVLRTHRPELRPHVDASRPRGQVRPLLALALVSGALTALLFGLVLLLIVGWAMRPLSAAFAVTAVPLAAFAGSLAGRVGVRVAAGCALVGGGVGALAFLPSNDVGWLIAPECVAGFGMGLALTPLLEHVLPDRFEQVRARNLVVRHLGVTLALVVLAPVVAHALNAATERAKLRTVAVVLDAPISPVTKIRVAPALVSSVHADRPLAAVRANVGGARAKISPGERRPFAAMLNRVETVFVRAAAEAFRTAFLVAAALALAAALMAAYGPSRPLMAVGVTAAGVALIAAQAIVEHFAAPAPVSISDPCRPRDLPRSGGVGGVAQSAVLRLLDVAACRLHVAREELLLALADDDESKRFQKRHSFDPTSFKGLLRLIG